MTFSSHTNRPQTWLIAGLVPADELTLLVGPSGCGKSTLISSFVASLHRQFLSPAGVVTVPRRALIYALEEDPAGEVLDRLEAAEAELGAVVDGTHLPDGGRAPLPYLPEKIAQLQQRVEACRASLLVIDPLTSLLGPGVSPVDPQHVRGVLTALADLARRCGCAVVVTCHHRKSTNGDPSNWISGSKEWWNVPSHILAAGPDPSVVGRYVLTHAKQRRGRPLPSRSYEIRDQEGAGRIQWLGESALAAADLHEQLEDSVDRSCREEARQWLRTLLATEEVRADRLLTQARSVGISDKTLRRAKADLGVVSEVRGAGIDPHWVWLLPPAGGQDGQSVYDTPPP